MSASPRRIAAPTAALLLALSVGGCGINNVPTYEQRAKAAWSEVQNQYQRRADLIPNLVETVKGYAKQEKDVLEAVVEARAKATQMQIPADILENPEAFKRFQENQAQLTGALSRLLAVSEQYPELKANQNFLALQAELSNTEDRLQTARRFYNSNVRTYNQRVQSFPSNLLANAFHFQEEEFFEVDEGIREAGAPRVNFTDSAAPGVSFGDGSASPGAPAPADEGSGAEAPPPPPPTPPST
jgi:LemA protein